MLTVGGEMWMCRFAEVRIELTISFGSRLVLGAMVCNRSGADNRHFYDLQKTANMIKYINTKK